MPKEQLIVYTSDDYSAPLSLVRSEKLLILKAAIRMDFVKVEMAEALHISKKQLFREIYSHSLGDLLVRRHKRKNKPTVLMMIDELDKLEKNYDGK